jgi:ribonucleotide reductase alpha subunit
MAPGLPSTICRTMWRRSVGQLPGPKRPPPGPHPSPPLFAEIVEYTSPNEIAVCSLASLSLPKFVVVGKYGEHAFDLDALQRTVQVVVRNLNCVIDRTFYPVASARASNLRHRPIGVGVQGLVDVFMMLRIPYDGPEARTLNKKIFETIYYAAVQASVLLAEEFGPYESFPGSPASRGLLQFDLWGHKPAGLGLDWAGLKERVIGSGMRNSLLTAIMPTGELATRSLSYETFGLQGAKPPTSKAACLIPTAGPLLTHLTTAASTGQLMGNTKATEPIKENLFVRKTRAGEFVLCNEYLVKDLLDLGLWSVDMKEKILAARGSVQAIAEIPDELKALYKTAFELKQKVLLDMAADRGPFIDQTQSTNLFMAKPTPSGLSSALFYAYKMGLKTGEERPFFRTTFGNDQLFSSLPFPICRCSCCIRTNRPSIPSQVFTTCTLRPRRRPSR